MLHYFVCHFMLSIKSFSQVVWRLEKFTIKVNKWGFRGLNTHSYIYIYIYIYMHYPFFFVTKEGMHYHLFQRWIQQSFMKMIRHALLY